MYDQVTHISIDVIVIITVFTCRLQIATLHFNENSCRKQAVTKEGKESYEIVFPKYKKGGYITRKITVDPTYSEFNPSCVYRMHFHL